jgi:hypothetical protein
MQTQPGHSSGVDFRTKLTYVVVILIFGVAVPASKGLGFFDPVLLAAYACLGIVFAGPAAAKAFERTPESLGQAVQWIVKAALFGELLAVTMLICGVGTVYARSRGVFFPPDLQSLAFALSLGMAASLALGALAGWVTVQISSGAARMVMRGIFLALVALFYLKGRWLPDVLEIGTLLCLVGAGILIVLLRFSLARRAAQP